MRRKTIGRALLFPPLPLMILLIPVAAGYLVYAMTVLGTESAGAIISYVLAAYTLTVWCFRIPAIIRFCQRVRAENRYVQRWRSDTRLRVNVSLYGTMLWNTAYAMLQLGMGAWHRSYWFYSLAAYYISLAAMRFFLVRHTRRHRPGEMMSTELRKYRACGMVFLLMNLVLTLMIFFMVYWNRTFHHHEITTIAQAAYTFGSLTMAIVNVVRYRKYQSPVYSASKAISLASACVSMLTLESTMLTTFGDGTMTLTGRRILLGVSGGAISALIIAMAVWMIVQGTKKLKRLEAARRE